MTAGVAALRQASLRQGALDTLALGGFAVGTEGFMIAAIPLVILSLNAAFMDLGFALGAACGALVILLWSVAWIGAVGAVCIVAATPAFHLAGWHTASP